MLHLYDTFYVFPNFKTKYNPNPNPNPKYKLELVCSKWQHISYP